MSNIRQGIKMEVEAERIGAYCHWFWKKHLKSHFKEEEKLLPPALAEDHPLIQRMVEEHESIRFLEKDIRENASNTVLEHFAHTLEEHIRFEEGLLFPEIVNAGKPEALQRIAKELSKEEGWDDPFWLTR